MKTIQETINLFERPILEGCAIYKTANGTKAKKDFDLGTVEPLALGFLDLEKAGEIIKEKYEMFIMNKAKKSQYKLTGMILRVWTSWNTCKDYNLKVND